MAKQGFNWKIIEEKPENWETVRSLVQDAYDPVEETADKYWNNPQVLKAFLESFPDLSAWVTLDPHEGEKGKKGKSGKKPPSKRDAIHQRVEAEIIRKDVQSIRFDSKTLQPIRAKYDMQVTFLLMVIVWNYLLQSKKRTAPKATVLDAIISFNRLYEDEYANITREDFRASLDHIRDVLRQQVTDEMYETLFLNPVLLVDCTAHKRGKPKRLYPEQKLTIDRICNSVLHNRPLLLGNQMPTGTGKTFLSAPLAKKMATLKLNKTVLFACSNELVNKDVSSTALVTDDLHVWLAKLIRQEGTNLPMVLLRPHKRCFPSTWKKIYKKEDRDKTGTIEEQWNFYTKATNKIPDIMIADLEATYEILKDAHLFGDPFVAYIDEFVSDEASNRLMAGICEYLPRQTVLLSAILPKFENMPVVVGHFCRLHSTTPEACLQRVATADVNISCAVIDGEGYLRMPHHQAKTLEDMEALHREIMVNPRIRRAYPVKHVFYWSKSVEHLLEPHGMTFSDRFPDIGRITTSRVIDYAIEMIGVLCKNPEHMMDFLEYRPVVMPPPDAMQMFKEQSRYYEGKTLYITNDVMKQTDLMISGLYDQDVKWSDIVESTKKNEAVVQKQTERLDKSKMSRIEKLQAMSELQETSTRVTLPPRYVVNSLQHFSRFHPKDTLKGSPRMAIDLPNHFESAFDEQTNMMMASGIGLYCKTHMTEFQRNLVMSIYDKLVFLCSNKDVVFGTNLPGLTNVFIDGSFAAEESVSTLYQLMGRVGRMGRSYHANIILNSEQGVEKVLSLGTNIDHESALLIESLLAKSL
jgi:hypothetical protein